MGDHTRWKPLFPLLAPHFTICGIDRRGHGESGDSHGYSLQKEADDVVAVVNSQPDTVFVLGHSYGAMCALEAAFLTPRISKLVLYEPPLLDSIDLAVVSKMEGKIQLGDLEQALVLFLQEIVTISPAEIAAMKARPSWPSLVASVPSSVRQTRAIATCHFNAKQMNKMTVPTLLLTGSESPPHLRQAITALQGSLPNQSLVVFQGQQHNAMDEVPQRFADTITSFLLCTSDKSSIKHR